MLADKRAGDEREGESSLRNMRLLQLSLFNILLELSRYNENIISIKKWGVLVYFGIDRVIANGLILIEKYLPGKRFVAAALI